MKRASPAPPRAVPAPREAGRRPAAREARRPARRRAPPPATPAAQARAAGASPGGAAVGPEPRAEAAYCFTLSPSASLRFFLAASSSLTKVAIAPSSRPDRRAGRRAAQPKNQRGGGLAPEAQPAPARPAPRRSEDVGLVDGSARLSEGKGRSQSAVRSALLPAPRVT